ATDQRTTIERNVVAHLHDRMLVHQHALGKRREVERLVQHLAFPGQPPCGAGQQLYLSVLAKIGMPGHALRTLAAEYREARDDVISRLDVDDILANRLHNAGCLMAKHAGGWPWVQTVNEMQVGMAK